jgi:choline dehydrogenase-like flavoprotein
VLLSLAQWRTLESVCETLIPDAVPELPMQLIEALSTTGDPADLIQFKQALTLLESAVVGFLVDGRRGRFSRLARSQQEAVLRRWATHPIPKLRQAFQAFKRLSGFLNFATDEAFWVHIGYPGVDKAEAGRPLLPMHSPGDATELFADAVVVGSGAGGGVVAAELARRGLHVIVLEKGGHFPEPTLGMRELDGMQKLYLDRGMTATRDLSVSILAGSTVGGGTTVNWAACIAPPDWLRTEWEQVYGLSGLTSPSFQACVDEVWKRLGVNSDSSDSLPASSAGLLRKGCEALGYHHAILPRNTVGCAADCSFCTFGCKAGAKQSTARTFLVDAVEHGAQIIADADVRRVLTDGGKVTGVEVEIGGRKVLIWAPRVVVAAGAISSPALLLRSGLTNPNIGRHLHLHPVVAVLGGYEEQVNPWSGRLLPAYSRQFQRLDGNYGFLLEVAPAHPGLGALATPWQSGQQYRKQMAQVAHTGVFIALVRDKGSGRVTVNRAGRHQIDYPISTYDMNHLLAGQRQAIRVHAAAGAKQIMTLHAAYNTVDAVATGAAGKFAYRSSRLSSGPNQLSVLSAHQMGTCRIGGSADTAVADPTGRVFGVKGLYVADGSVFPSASGVNPMISIMSLAQWIAKQIR